MLNNKKNSQSFDKKLLNNFDIDDNLTTNNNLLKEQFDIFLNNHGFDGENLLSRNKDGHSVLTLALSKKLSKEFISYIISKDKSGILTNCDCQVVCNKDNIILSPLEIALNQSSAEYINLLLDNGVDFNQSISDKNQTIYQILTDKDNLEFYKDEIWQKIIQKLEKFGAHNNTSIAYIPHAPIESLVFEGSGVRGMVYLGAIRALDERGVLDKLKRVGGVSSGSIAALFVALGIDIKKMEKLMMEATADKFMQVSDDSLFNKFWHGLLSLIGYCIPKLDILKSVLPGMLNENHGTYKLDQAKAWLDDRIYEVIGIHNATLKDLHDAKKNNPKIKDLYVELCNLTTQSGEVWSYESHPNAKIIDVIGASISFPLAFELSHTKVDGKYYSYSDGGIYDNAPVLSMFNSNKYLPKGYNFDNKGANPGVYVLKVDSKDECDNLLWRKGEGREDINYTKTEFMKDIILSFGNKQQLVAEMYATRIIQLYDGGIGTLQTDVNDTQKKDAIVRGYKSTIDHLETYRGHGTYYFMFNPKKFKDTKDINLIDRPELNIITNEEKLKKLELHLIDKLKKLRNLKTEYYKGNSVIMLKSSLYRRLACVRYVLNQYNNNLEQVNKESAEETIDLSYKIVSQDSVKNKKML